MQSLRSTSVRRLCLSVTASVTRRPQNPLLSVLTRHKQSFTPSSTRWYSSTGQFHPRAIEEAREEIPSEAEEVEKKTKSQTNTLYLGNLPYSTTEDELREILSVYGPLTRVAMAKQDGKPMGYAHVDFESKRDAAKAIKDHDESSMVIGDREIRMDYAHPLGQKGDSPSPRRAVKDRHEPSHTVFVGNVSYEAKEKDIHEALKSFGNVVAVRIALDREGNPKGFAHVDFANTAEAEKVLEHYQHNPIHILDREIRMDRTSPPETAYSPSTRLYFTKWEGNGSSLRSHFGALRSKIMGIYFVKNLSPEVLTSSGFIEFRDLETAREALMRFNAPGLTLAYARSGDRSKSRPATRRDGTPTSFGLRRRKERD